MLFHTLLPVVVVLLWLVSGRSATTQTVDLAVIGSDFEPLQVSPNHLLPGNSTTLGPFVVYNAGTGSTGSFSIGFYLSGDTNIDPLVDRKVGSSSVTSLGSQESRHINSTALSIPPDVAPGKYYVGIVVDDTNSIAESNEANNTVYAPHSLEVQRRMAVDLLASGGPTLIVGDGVFSPVSSTIAAISSNGRFRVAPFSILNTGTENSPAFTVNLLISTDATVSESDAHMGSFYVDHLAPGGSFVWPQANLTDTFTLPNAVGPAGTSYSRTYYFLLVVDAYDNVVEDFGGRESNNVLSNRIEVMPGPSDLDNVWRVQLELSTGTASRAGTNDDVYATLNSTNRTWMDYGQDDFERGHTFVYDLVLDDVTTVGDITSVRLGKVGTNGWCVRSARLTINLVEVATKTFSGTCTWLDPPNSSAEMVVFTYAELRRHPKWRDLTEAMTLAHLYDAAFRAGQTGLLLSRNDLESIIEANVGHLIHGTPIYWGKLHGRAVEVTRKDARTFSVDLDLAGDVPGPDVEIDVDFDVGVACACGQTTSTAMNPRVNVDQAWYQEVLSLGMAEVVDRIASHFASQGLSTSLDALSGSFPAADKCPIIQITANGDILLQVAPSAVDLSLTSIVNVASAKPGDLLSVTANILNVGNQPATGVIVSAVLGRAGIPGTTSETELSHATVDRIPACTPATTVTLPVRLPDSLQCSGPVALPMSRPAIRSFNPLSYYLSVSASAPGEVTPQNNRATHRLSIGASDLRVTKVKTALLRVRSGSAVPVEVATIRNDGLFASGAVRYRWFLSRAQQIDGSATELHSSIGDPLQAGESRNLSGAVAIPTDVGFGPYYLILKVEEADGRYECTTSNNTGVQLLIIE